MDKVALYLNQSQTPQMKCEYYGLLYETKKYRPGVAVVGFVTGACVERGTVKIKIKVIGSEDKNKFIINLLLEITDKYIVLSNISIYRLIFLYTLTAFNCSKSTMKITKQCVKSVRS